MRPGDVCLSPAWVQEHNLMIAIAFICFIGLIGYQLMKMVDDLNDE
jgi:hypothetical protein